MTKETIGTVLITEEQIREKAEEIGRQISEDDAGEEIVMIGILRGAVPWMADVMKCSSYGAATKSSGVVKINKDRDTDIEGKHVIIMEDIVDSGVTLNYLEGYLKSRGAASIKLCALLDKPEGRRVDIKADYVGFTVDDRFIVGYGLDYDQKFRNLPYITWLESE